MFEFYKIKNRPSIKFIWNLFFLFIIRNSKIIFNVILLGFIYFAADSMADVLKDTLSKIKLFVIEYMTVSKAFLVKLISALMRVTDSISLSKTMAVWDRYLNLIKDVEILGSYPIISIFTLGKE